MTGCWTGSTPTPSTPAPEPPPSQLEITMQRTPCFGSCPAYTVSVDGDGRVKWHGDEFVEAVGDRRATIPPKRVKEILRKLDEVKFFDRNERGELPSAGFECTRSGNTTSCSFQSVTICSDQTGAIVTVRRGYKKHTVRNDHCVDSPLDELENLIDEVAHTTAWIGKSVSL